MNMRVGCINYSGWVSEGAKSEAKEYNVGDIFQTVRIEEIISEMMSEGTLPLQEIIKIDFFDIDKYEGDALLVPVSFVLTNLISSKITPVFLGLSYKCEELTNDEIDYLKRNEPIGCRDERTMFTCKKYGIESYRGGCVVLTYPRRRYYATQTKVLFVDAQKYIKDVIPQKLLENYEFISHEGIFTDDFLKDFEGGIYGYADYIKKKYEEEARLIVTSRFHAAVIALAMGIPVIFTTENYMYKYTWLRKYIPIYTPDTVHDIDWEPKTVIIPDEEKKIIVQSIKSRIAYKYYKNNNFEMIDGIFNSGDMYTSDDIRYDQEAIRYIKKEWEENYPKTYSIWGITETARHLVDYIGKAFPSIKLKNVYDSFKRGEWKGYNILIPKEKDIMSDDFIFVTGNNACASAISIFNVLGYEKYFTCQRNFLNLGDIEDGKNELN